MQSIENSIAAHIKLCQELSGYIESINTISQALISVLKNKGKILIAGNGGSAADSQHMAAELVGRFKKDRQPIPAIALTTDTSILTAVGNDLGFDKVFSQQVQALGREKDALLILSTSGKSQNLIEAIQAAQAQGIITLALLGKNGGKAKDLADYSLVIPSGNTARIQEMHILIIHIISEIIEQTLFPD